ncbi:N-acetylmuramoyl-L-alanine amidase [Hyphomicrobium sp.]|uniref:N-acetylmuramoyl-L-alanine amidase n=1 Tax=Hyphomicrobium sp. TaxID=82 RepID=UPI0025C015D3|nr:N-acetylmuramoyl-L-alanine amidase [Hyphomicrobium sp.]MCC7252075.1 N-acetylmuramoyl-L-alanine amidase [Hyphomicrobium sp.]
MGIRAGSGGLRTLATAVAVLMHVWLWAGAAAGETASATRASLSGDQHRTTFQLDLTVGVPAEIYTLANPYRVIVDLPDVEFRLPDGTGQDGGGLVRTFRYGLFAEGKARVVLDTTGPVRIERAAMTAATGGKGIVFAFDMVTTDPASFGLGTGADKAAEDAPEKAPPAGPPDDKPKRTGKAVIMIDPGHGGIDGGAVSASSLLEKDVVLAVGKELGRQLAASGRYDVHMTRSSDVFVSLDQRLNLSAKHGVDLFISLHADSLAVEAEAQAVRGATIYTLSERASDEQARRMAEKENASDLIAGINVVDGPDDDEVKSILFDLMKRETANFSADFSNTLVHKLKSAKALSRVPQRAAAFKVLKQTHAPSVLIELGYLSNPEDEKLLNSTAWRKKIAASITTAIDDYFSKRTASSPGLSRK